jgi:hypothetical protein
MADPDKIRKSGRTTGEEHLKEVSEEADEPINPELDVERRTRFSRTGFSRMSLDWRNEDRVMMDRIHSQVDAMIAESFDDLLSTHFELVDRVRNRERAADGEIDWEKRPSGMYVEDWTRLTTKERTSWIFRLQTSIVDWERRANAAHAEAMFMKAKWEDAFAIGFESRTSGTIPEREARGRLHSREERYFAIYVDYYSRVAQSHVKNMRDLLLRISQIHQAASGR